MASLELMRGPPRNRASRSLILSMAVVMATASEVVMILLVVEVATTAEEEEEVAEFAIPFDVAFVVLFVVAEFVDIFFFGQSTIDFASFFLAF